MTPVVLDTDVVSFLFKDDTRAQRYIPHLRDRQWLVSFMTEAELEQWAFSQAGSPSARNGREYFLQDS